MGAFEIVQNNISVSEERTNLVVHELVQKLKWNELRPNDEIQTKLSRSETAYLKMNMLEAHRLAIGSLSLISSDFAASTQSSLIERACLMIWLSQVSQDEFDCRHWASNKEFSQKLPTSLKLQNKKALQSSVFSRLSPLEQIDQIWMNGELQHDLSFSVQEGSHIFVFRSRDTYFLYTLELKEQPQWKLRKTKHAKEVFPKQWRAALRSTLLKHFEKTQRLEVRYHPDQKKQLIWSARPRRQQVSATLEKDRLQLQRADSADKEEALSWLRSPWFWLGIGAVSGTAGYFIYDATQSPEVRTR